MPAPTTIHRMGFDTTGHLLQMSRATAAGIHRVFQLIPAVRADVITGAIIRATTAGRIPLKILTRVGFVLIFSGVRNMAIARMMRKEGRIVPKAEKTLPNFPLILSPTATDMLTARMPGKDWATASMSRKSSLSSQ